MNLAAQSQSLLPIEKNDRGTLVRAFYDRWVELGGTNDGHRVRSVKRMRAWLGKDNQIRSLEPKLSGKTNLKREDATKLFRLFLSKWHRGNKLGNEKPYVDGDLDPMLERLLNAFYPANDQNRTNKFLLPDKKNANEQSTQEPQNNALREGITVLEELFEESDAVITVSRTRTVSDVPDAIKRFQELMDRFREIDGSDNRQRILMWIVDIGRRTSDDPKALLALRNLDALAFQFRAIALADHPERIERWRWLEKSAVILVGSIKRNEMVRFYEKVGFSISQTDMTMPWVYTNLLLLSETPDEWAKAQELRLLYGQELERLEERAFSIHANRSGWNDSRTQKLRYIGFEPPMDDKFAINSEAPRHAIELPSPSRRHDEAFEQAYAAACYRMQVNLESFDDCFPAQSFGHLMHYNFIVLKLNEFLNITQFLTHT